MIEIFRTNVTDKDQAEFILSKIHSTFPGYFANFDIDDCDHILRIDSGNSLLIVSTILQVLLRLGCEADVLPDLAVENFALNLEK